MSGLFLYFSFKEFYSKRFYEDLKDSFGDIITKIPDLIMNKVIDQGVVKITTKNLYLE